MGSCVGAESTQTKNTGIATMPTACVWACERVCVCVVQMSLLTHSLFVQRSAFTDSAFLPLNSTAIAFFSRSLCPSLAQPLLRHAVSKQPKHIPLKINGPVTTDKTKYDWIKQSCWRSSEFGLRSSGVWEIYRHLSKSAFTLALIRAQRVRHTTREFVFIRWTKQWKHNASPVCKLLLCKETSSKLYHLGFFFCHLRRFCPWCTRSLYLQAS